MGRAAKNLHRQMLNGGGEDYTTMPGGDSTTVKKPKPKPIPGRVAVDTTALKERIQKSGDIVEKLQDARAEGGVNAYEKNKYMNPAIDASLETMASQMDTLKAARKKPFKDSKLKDKIQGY